MKMFLRDGESSHEISVSDLSVMNIRQAAAITDAVARLIPHEGVDYEIKGDGVNFSFNGITDKGELWCRFIHGYAKKHPINIKADADAMKNLMSYVFGLIPIDGVDYEPIITFTGASSEKITFKIEPKNEKGMFWARYVAEMMKKYPPSADYRAETLPEEPEPVEGIPEEFKEVKDEKVVY